MESTIQRDPFSVQVSQKPAENPPPLRWCEIVTVLTLVVLSDLTIYRGQGFAGYGLLFVTAPGLLWLGARRSVQARGGLLIGLMLLALAAKLVWCGSEILVVLGFALVVAFAMTQAGRTPFVLATLAYAAQSIAAGASGLRVYEQSLRTSLRPLKKESSMSVILPLMAFVAFGSLFVLANPDLFASFSDRIHQWLEMLNDWLIHFSLLEVPFWFAVAWIVIGLLRPARVDDSNEPLPSSDPASNESTAPAPLYAAYRNTLLTVIALFATYLVFEFQTLWFRVFPKGFHYSGYAHEGAAWLTFALALATVVLSLIFRGEILRSERLPRLKRLAWTWSGLNFLLAIAVYHRLFIYVGFNGITRMRIVGLFGMTTVVVGFVLVLWKIAYGRDFVWLFRHHLWALAAAIYLHALTPVDSIVVNYNVQRILAGDPAPCVQISVHPISSEGVLLLQPLLECRDETIREGVAALLAQRDEDATELARTRAANGWTAHQLADELVIRGLRSGRETWSRYADTAKRHEAWEQFRKYAYQWF